MNDIKSKLQDLERRLNRETESRQQDTKFNLSFLTLAQKDISRLYKSQTELREVIFKVVDFWRVYSCFYFGVSFRSLYFSMPVC